MKKAPSINSKDKDLLNSSSGQINYVEFYKEGGEKNMKRQILSLIVAIFMLIALVVTTGCGGGGSSSSSNSSGSITGSGK